MSQLLTKVVPLVDFYFGKEGVSSTVANARKNELANENSNLMKDLYQTELYDTHMTLLSDKEMRTIKVDVRKLEPKGFDVLKTVAKNYAECAILGNGIKIFNQSMEVVRSLPARELLERSGVDVSLPTIPVPPTRKSVVEGKLNYVLELERVEDILNACRPAVLERLDAEMIRKALRLESEAATLGNEITQKDRFLQRVISAETTLPSNETIASFALVVKQPKLAYSPEEVEAFKTLFAELTKQYQQLQGQLNGIKKTIKDTIRLTELEFAKAFEAQFSAYQKQNREYSEKAAQMDAQGEVLRQQLIQELLALKIQTA